MVAGEITALLKAAGSGDAKAMQALFARVYDELKQIARKRLAASSAHSLNTTGLVHEAYLKLAQPDVPSLHGRVHFFALAAKAMRQIVIDHARARATDKRGGENLQMADLDEAIGIADSEPGPDELLRLNHALDLLEGAEPRLAQLVELRFFAGLSIGEISSLREVSERTLNRDWRRAKAQLYATLHPEI
jgi:RNA polymerase sigma factor (TIGR02999 family)